jgi:hypothetical protein
MISSFGEETTDIQKSPLDEVLRKWMITEKYNTLGDRYQGW